MRKLLIATFLFAVIVTPDFNRAQIPIPSRDLRDRDRSLPQRNNDDNGAMVRFVEVNNSGIRGKCDITQIFINGTPALHFDCKANGFDPNFPYVSLVYDVRSIGPRTPGAILNGNPNVCLPGIPAGQPGALGLLPMIVGGNPYWQPLVGSNNRSLEITSFGVNFTNLANIGTMSVRKDTNFGPVFQVNAARLNLQACGNVVFGY